jgi:hypothetical protein
MNLNILKILENYDWPGTAGLVVIFIVSLLFSAISPDNRKTKLTGNKI